MAQTTALVDTLKKALKAHGLTYADVARQLELTEASVKRLFSQRSFSLHRLDRVCQLMSMEISDLVQLMKETGERRLSELSEDQEREIVGDTELMLVTLCVLNRWTVEDILARYDLPQTRVVSKLARLDRLRIIELLPHNRVKLLVAPNFNWRKNGPIQRFFQQKVEAEFFRTPLVSEGDALIVANGMLSANANAVLRRKMVRLATEFDELNDDDAGLAIDGKHWNTLVLAVRQWEYGLFDPLRRR